MTFLLFVATFTKYIWHNIVIYKIALQDDKSPTVWLKNYIIQLNQYSRITSVFLTDRSTRTLMSYSYIFDMQDDNLFIWLIFLMIQKIQFANTQNGFAILSRNIMHFKLVICCIPGNNDTNREYEKKIWQKVDLFKLSIWN